MNQQNERTLLRITEPGYYPLYRSEDGEFEMEHSQGYGWKLYAVLPRHGRFLLGEDPFRTSLAAEFNLKLEARE